RAAEKKRAAAIVALENRIEAAESSLREVEVALADPSNYSNGARAKELVTRQRRTRDELDSLWKEMERVAEGK
ncbi:MAG: hypothetical protein FD129_2995, partial [bacterium]